MKMTLAQFRARFKSDPFLAERMARARPLPQERLPEHLTDAQLAELVRRRAWERLAMGRVEVRADRLVYPPGWPPGSTGPSWLKEDA